MRLREELTGLRAGPSGVSARVAMRPRGCSGNSARRRLTAATSGNWRRQKQARVINDNRALEPLDALVRMALLEILEDRHGRASALMVSQLPVSSWHEVIGEPTIADAICDRIVHGAHRIKLQGDSVRKLYAAACQPGSNRAAGIAPPGATTATGWSVAAVRGAPGRRRPPEFRRDVALGLGPPTAAWHRRAESLPQASRGPGTPPPVIPRHRRYRTAAPQMTIRCRVALQTGNYPHTAGFFADQIAAFPSTRPRANITAPLLRLRPGFRRSGSSLSAAGQNYSATLFTRKFNR